MSGFPGFGLFGRWVTMTSVFLALVGCAAVDPAERFPTVVGNIEQRLGQRVHWRLGGPEDEEVDAFVRDLLAQPLTPDTAVQVALLRRADLQAVYEDLGVAQADLVHAGMLTNPDLAGFVRFPDSGGASRPNWNVGLDFWLDMFVVPLRKRIAGEELEQAILRVTDAVLDKATEVRRACHRYQGDLQVLEASRALTEFADVAVELVERQHAAGHISDLELARERAAAERSGLRLDQAETAASIAREELRRALDLRDDESDWSLSPAQETVAGGEPDVQALVATALETRADLALLQRQIERERFALILDKQWLLTKGAVGVETERSSDGVQSTGPHFSVELPIFHQHQAVYARREALIRQAEQRLLAQRNVAHAEVRMATDRMSLARRMAERYQQRLLPLQQRVVELTQTEYNAMLVGVFDLLRAKEGETADRVEYARALQDYWTSRADLERVIGIRLPDLVGASPVPSMEESPGESKETATPHPGHERD